MKLILPDERHLKEFIKAGEEYKKRNVSFYKGFYVDEPMEYIKKCEEYRIGKNLKPDRVPQTTYWLIGDNDELIGQIAIRHKLNELLLIRGGNIGYGIVPKYWGQGYGTLMLKMALDKCRQIKLDKVLVTCAKENIASARVIEKNGGILENEIEFEGTTYKRYWITL